jgi:hypothetical protein
VRGLELGTTKKETPEGEHDERIIISGGFGDKSVGLKDERKRRLTCLILSFRVKNPDRQTTPANGEGLMRPVRIEIAAPVVGINQEHNRPGKIIMIKKTPRAKSTLEGNASAWFVANDLGRNLQRRSARREYPLGLAFRLTIGSSGEI